MVIYLYSAKTIKIVQMRFYAMRVTKRWGGGGGGVGDRQYPGCHCNLECLPEPTRACMQFSSGK